MYIYIYYKYQKRTHRLDTSSQLNTAACEGKLFEAHPRTSARKEKRKTDNKSDNLIWVI